MNRGKIRICWSSEREKREREREKSWVSSSPTSESNRRRRWWRFYSVLYPKGWLPIPLVLVAYFIMAGERERPCETVRERVRVRGGAVCIRLYVRQHIAELLRVSHSVCVKEPTVLQRQTTDWPRLFHWIILMLFLTAHSPISVLFVYRSLFTSSWRHTAQQASSYPSATPSSQPLVVTVCVFLFLRSVSNNKYWLT